MNTRAFTWSWLVAAGVLSSFAVSFASDQPAAPAALSADVALPPALPSVTRELEASVARLRSWTHAAAIVEPPARDPFAFAGSARSRVASLSRGTHAPRVPATQETVDLALVAAAEADANELTLPAPVVALPSLSAVAELAAGSLTAVISWRDSLHYVTAGEMIESRYRVDRVGSDGADIFDLVLGTTSRLTLR